jgi:PAS domain S-box-containing protein
LLVSAVSVILYFVDFLTFLDFFYVNPLYCFSLKPDMNKINATRQNSMQHIVDKLPAVIFEYSVFPDGSRDFTYVSPRCEEILGLSQEVILGGIFPLSSFIHPDDWPSFTETSENSIASLTEWKWEGRMLHEKRVIWVETIGVPTRMDDGRVAWSGIITDVTVRKDFQQRQRDAEKSYRGWCP